MAKETKKETTQATQMPAGMTSDNVMDTIRKGNLMSQIITQQVNEEIEKERDERKANALKGRILKASYRRLSKLLQVRMRRRESDITLEILKKSELLEDSLSGFVLSEDKIKKHGGKDGKLELEVLTDDGKKEMQTFVLEKGKEVWVPGTITVTEYDEKSEELISEERKKRNESDTQYAKELKELQAQYPGYFSYSWNW